MRGSGEPMILDDPDVDDLYTRDNIEDELDEYDDVDVRRPRKRRSANDRRAGATKPNATSAPRWKRVAREYIVMAVIALIAASIVRAFIGQAFKIPSESMVPTLKIGDRVIASRVNYHVSEPKRGDIVVFRNPNYEDRGRKDPFSKTARNVLELVGVGQPREKYYIKRIIGLPGEKLVIKEQQVWINGKPLSEPWLVDGVTTTLESDVVYGEKEFVIPLDQYFMMGDNRDNSQDSRYFGPIKKSSMIGKAVVRFFPLSRAGGFGVNKSSPS